MRKLIYALLAAAVLFVAAASMTRAEPGPDKVQEWSDASVRIVQTAGYGSYAYSADYREVTVAVRSSAEWKTVTLEVFTPANTLAEWKKRAVEAALRRYFRSELPRSYRLEVVFRNRR